MKVGNKTSANQSCGSADFYGDDEGIAMTAGLETAGLEIAGRSSNSRAGNQGRPCDGGSGYDSRTGSNAGLRMEGRGSTVVEFYMG